MKKTLALLIFFTVGWGAKPLNAPVSAQILTTDKQQVNSSPRTTPIIQSHLELLNAGAKPRQQLRFQPSVNAKETTTMTLNMDFAMSVAGKSMPPFKTPASVITMETNVTQVDANGNIHAKVTYTNADVIPDNSMSPKAIEAIRSRLKALVGTSSFFVIDNRGKPITINFSLPPGLDANSKKIFNQLSDSMNQVSAPLPAEAIGIGAQWRNSTSVNFNGVNLPMTTTYQLVNFKDGVATLNVSINGDAKSQKLILPEMPTKTNINLKSLNLQGQGQVQLSLNKLEPIISNLSTQVNIQMEVSNPSRSKPVTIGTKTSITLVINSK